MEQNQLLLRRVQLKAPITQQVKISEDLKKIYYDDGGKKTVLKFLDNTESWESIKKRHSFIDIKVTKADQYLFVNAHFDIVKMKEFVNKPYLLKDRLGFYRLLSNIISQNKEKFLASYTKELFSSAIYKQNDENISSWISKREKGDTFYSYEDGVVKIGPYGINTKKGKLLSEVNTQTINLKGGIVLDKCDYNWINDIVLNALNDTKNLIICAGNMVEMWKQQIDDCITITSKRDHNKLTYGQIKNVSFVIVSLEYFTSKYYENCWEQYKLDETMSFTEIFNLIKEEYRNYENMDSLTNPILSIIEWNRLIIDASVFQDMSIEPNIMNLVLTIPATIRWLQMKELSNVKEDYEFILNYLSGVQNSFPWYDSNGKISHPTDLIDIVDQINSPRCSAVTLDEKTEKVRMFSFEKAVSELYERKKKNGIEHAINRIVSASWSKSKVDIVPNNTCAICKDKIAKSVLATTDCGHFFCTACLEENTFVSNKCPCCRSPVDTYHKINSNKLNISSKIKHVKTLIADNNSKSIIYVSTPSFAEYLVSVIPNSLAIAGTSNKMNALCATDSTNYIIPFKHHSYSRNISGVQIIIFYDEYDNEISRSGFYGADYNNLKINTLQIRHLVYSK